MKIENTLDNQAQIDQSVTDYFLSTNVLNTDLFYAWIVFIDVHASFVLLWRAQFSKHISKS